MKRIDEGADIRCQTRTNINSRVQEAMVQLYKSGKSRTNLVREYDLSASALDRWITQSQKTGSFKEFVANFYK